MLVLNGEFGVYRRGDRRTIKKEQSFEYRIPETLCPLMIPPPTGHVRQGLAQFVL